MKTWNVINANGEVIRQIKISSMNSKVNQLKIVSAKVKFLYGDAAVFLKIEVSA